SSQPKEAGQRAEPLASDPPGAHGSWSSKLFKMSWGKALGALALLALILWFGLRLHRQRLLAELGRRIDGPPAIRRERERMSRLLREHLPAPHLSAPHLSAPHSEGELGTSLLPVTDLLGLPAARDLRTWLDLYQRLRFGPP